MSRTHFYLTLPSNASMNILPDNKTSGYRVRLPRVFNLDGDWEVGLYSLSYPNSWYTIEKYENHVYYKNPTDNFFRTISKIDFGHYETTESVITVTNEALLPQTADNIQLTYNPISKKVKTQIKNGYQFLFTDTMSLIFGYGGKETVVSKTEESPYVSILSTLSTIYIYCDIVQQQVVGDTNAPLLRTVPVEGKYGDNSSTTFANIQYVPVQTKSFEDVEILLRTGTGDPVSFEFGKVIVTLHFRRRAYF